jgi:hypothetical protein
MGSLSDLVLRRLPVRRRMCVWQCSHSNSCLADIIEHLIIAQERRPNSPGTPIGLKERIDCKSPFFGQLAIAFRQ